MNPMESSFQLQAVTADQRHEFHPQQWVNVWIVDVLLKCEYMQTCQVQELDPDEMGYDPETLILEPVHEDGQPMTYLEARARMALQP